jgi:hypothetical protein
METYGFKLDEFKDPDKDEERAKYLYQEKRNHHKKLKAEHAAGKK